MTISAQCHLLGEEFHDHPRQNSPRPHPSLFIPLLHQEMPTVDGLLSLGQASQWLVEDCPHARVTEGIVPSQKAGQASQKAECCFPPLHSGLAKTWTLIYYH